MQMSTKNNSETEKLNQKHEKPDTNMTNGVETENQHITKDIANEVNIEGLEKEDNTLEISTQSPYLKNCPKHPEEDLQFYCFNKDQVLCSECLVSGKYVGLEIANVRKAADKLKGRFNDFVAKTLEKFDAFDALGKDISEYEEEIKKATLTSEEEISKFFTEIREKINIKEQEFLDNLTALREERFTQFKSMEAFVKNYKDMVDHEKTSLKEEIKNLDELEFCQYYAYKTDTLKCLLAENDLKAEVIKEKIESNQLQDQINLSKLQDECKSISSHLDTLGGTNVFQLKQTNKDDLKLNKIPSFFSNIETDKNTLKESRETLFLRPPTPSRSIVGQKPSYLPEDQSTSGILSRSPTNKVFEKHMAKVQEIRKQAPKQDLRTDTLLTSPDTKTTASRTSLILDIKRNILNKKFSGLSLTESSPALENYKDILSKKSEPKTPKTFMLPNSLTPKSLGSDIYSPNNLKANSLMSSITTKNVDKPDKFVFDATSRYMKIDKNPYELQNAELSRRTTSKPVRESESLKTLNIDKMFSKRKVPERTEVCSVTSVGDGGMKKKLDNLSISLFK